MGWLLKDFCRRWDRIMYPHAFYHVHEILFWASRCWKIDQ